LNVTDSVAKLDLRTFASNLDRKWSWWRSKSRKTAAPIIPDDRGLIYLPNFHENYVVAVTPLDHDLVYVAELNAPLRVASGVLAGLEVVLVLCEDGKLHVLSNTLILQQTITLSEAATDLVWADNLLWLVGEDRHHIDVLQVYEQAEGELSFREYRVLSGISDIRHVLYLPLARTIAAVSTDTIHFISSDEFTSESVPLPTTIHHAAAHDALLVFTEQATGDALVLDLSTSAILPLYTVAGRQTSDDPIIKEHQGFYEEYHGKFTVDLVSFQEPEDSEVRSYVQTIEQANGMPNEAQPELIIQLQEKADFFRLPTIRDCVAGEHYESEPFTLAGDGTPLLVVTDGCTVIVPADDLDPDSTETEAFAVWVTDEELRLKRQFNKPDGLHHRARASIYEAVSEVITFDELSSPTMTGIDYQAKAGTTRLVLSNPVESNGFWIGSYESELFPVHEMTILNSIVPDVYSLIPEGTSVTTEFRAQYRDSQTLSMRYSEWDIETPVIPNYGRLVALQIRVYMTTATLDKTPEISGFDVDQIRHELLTVGFWDNHRQSAVNATSLPMLSSVHSSLRATGVYHAKMIDLTADTRMKPASSMSPASMQRQHYTLGDTINVRWQNSSYVMQRMTSQFKIGLTLFRAAPNQITNWTGATQSFLDRQLFEKTQRLSSADHGQRKGIQHGQDINSVLLWSRKAQTQSLQASGVYSVNTTIHKNLFGRMKRTSLSRNTLGTRVYHNHMSMGDIQHYIGLRNYVTRITNEKHIFTLHTHSIELADDALFGANYPSKAFVEQATSFILSSSNKVEAVSALRPAPYHIPLNGVQSLTAVGMRNERGVLGYDSDSYTFETNSRVSSYEAMLGKLASRTTSEQATHGASSRSNAAESVLDVLTASKTGSGHFQIAQQVTSWRSRLPNIDNANVLYAKRGIWSMKSDLDAWLAQPISSQRTLVSDSVTAIEAQHLSLKTGQPLSAHILGSHITKQGKTIRLRAVARTMASPDPLSAYPMQTYTSTLTQALTYSKGLGMRSLAQKEVMSAFISPSNKVQFAETIKYLVSSGSRIQVIQQAIKYAFDLMAISPVDQVPFETTSSLMSSMAQAVTLSREVPTRSTAATAFDVVPHTKSLEANGLSASLGGWTDGLGRINMEAAGQQSTPQAEPMSFVYEGRNIALTDLVYEVVKGWSGETSTEVSRFTKAILNAEGAEGMKPLITKFNGAMAEIVKGIASGGSVTTAQMVKFLTVAYLTSNLTNPVKTSIESGSSLASIVGLIYNTLQSSTFTEDISLSTDVQTTAVNQVILTLLRDSAVTEQKAIFSRVSGTNMQRASTVSIRRYRWQSGLSDRISNVPSIKSLTNVVFDKSSKFASSATQASSASLGFTVLSGLELSVSETVAYNVQSPYKISTSAALYSMSQPTTLNSKRISFLQSRISSLQADPMPAALGKTSMADSAVSLVVSGGKVLDSRTTFVRLSHTQSQLGQSTFEVVSGLGNASTAKMHGSMTHTHTFDGANMRWSFGKSTSKGSRVSLISLRGAKPVTQSAVYQLWSGYNPYQPMQFESVAHRSNDVEVKLIELVTNGTTALTARSGALVKATLRSTVQTMPLAKDGNLGLLSQVIGHHVGDGFRATEQRISLTSAPIHTIDDVGISFNAKGWQTRLQNSMTEWAIQNLKGIPHEIFYTMPKDSVYFSELVNFRFGKLGMTLNDLVDMVKLKSSTLLTKGQSFHIANWTNVIAQSNYKVLQPQTLSTDITLTGHWGMTAHKPEPIALTKLGAANFWINQMNGHTTETGTKFGQLVTSVVAESTPAELSRAKHTVATFNAILQGDVRYEVFAEPRKLSPTMDYLKVTRYQSYIPTDNQFAFNQSASLVPDVPKTDVASQAGFMNSTHLRKVGAYALTLSSRIDTLTDALGRHTNLQLVNSIKEDLHIITNKAYANKMASTVKQPVSVAFHITGSLTIPGGRHSKTKDVTVLTQSSPWSYSQTMRLTRTGIKLHEFTAPLQRIGMTKTSTNITHLSTKARYWLPKINFNFPVGVPRWLQDYGYISLGLGGQLPNAAYTQDTSDKNPEVSTDGSRWLIETTTTALGADKALWAQESREAFGVEVGTTVKAGFNSLAQLSPYVVADVAQDDKTVTVNKILGMNLLGLPMLAPKIIFERLRPTTRPESTAIFNRVLDSTIGSQATSILQTSASWSAYSNEISKRFDSNVGATRHSYELALPEGVPIGMATRTEYSPVSTVVSADFRITMRRNEIGYDLQTSRAIGEKAITTPIPVKIDKLGRVNPQTVAHVAKTISTVLRDAVNRVSDNLDYERLSAPSESQAYQRWVAELTGLAMQNWDYTQRQVAVSAKHHPEIIKLMRQDWFGEAWHTQQEASLANLAASLVQALKKPIKLGADYRQFLSSDSQLLSTLVQAERVNNKVYTALVQAGLSETQVDMVLRQTQASMADHYNRIKQYQLGGIDTTFAFDQEALSAKNMDRAYEQNELSAKALDRLYEQYELSMAKLYSQLKQMGLSDAQIRLAYAQARPDADSDLIVQSKYASYDNMVSAVGAAFEQYLLSDTAANMHYKMHRPMDAFEEAKYLGQTTTTPDAIDLYKQAELGNSDPLGLEYTVEMATILDSVDYSLMKPLPFHDRVDVNLPIKFRSEDYRRYKAGIVAIDLMQWLRDLRTKYREELVAKIHAGKAKGTYSPRAAMMEAVRNNIVEPILYRDPKDGSWLYRQFSISDTEYNYIIWGGL
jgi:hypothetical protein